MEQTISWGLKIVAGYLLLGLTFGIPFVIKGVVRIDPTAKDGATWGFRLAILPASIVFWPYLIKRWLSGVTEPPEENSPHRCAACGECPCDKGTEA